MMLHTYTPNQYPNQLLSFNFQHLTLSEIQPRQDFQTQGHYRKVKVKTRSHHDVTHLQTLTNTTTKYQLPTPYGFLDIARTKFERSVQQGQSCDFYRYIKQLLSPVAVGDIG